MKKTALLACVLFLALAAFPAFAQTTQNRMLDLKTYFMLTMELDSPQWNFTRDPLSGDDPVDNARFSNLTGNLAQIDSYLEFALLIYYSRAERQWAELGNSILPLNNPRLADQKLGAAVFQEMQVLSFLGSTAALARHETMLQFITSRGNSTRAEMENFYRQGIHGLVADTVNEEFNRIGFSLNNLAADRTYNSVLIRNPQNGSYTLRYERPSIANDDKEISAASIEALVSAMSGSGDFVQSDINIVREQAALIPGVVYADWKSRNVAGGVDALALITDTLTDFYLNPNQTTYNNVLGINARYNYMAVREQDVFAIVAQDSLRATFSALSQELSSKIGRDISTGNVVALMRIPNDPRFNVFSTRF